MKISNLISLEHTIQNNIKIPKQKKQEGINSRPISALLDKNRNRSKNK